MNKRKVKTPKYVEQKLLEEYISGTGDVRTGVESKDNKKVGSSEYELRKKIKIKGDSIILKHTGYVIRGMADLSLWIGGSACISMKPFRLKRLTKKAMLENLNDNGFGSMSINGAICEIWKDYEGHEIYQKTVEVGSISVDTRNKFWYNV